MNTERGFLRPALWVVAALGIVALIVWRASAWNAPATSTDQTGGTAVKFGNAPALTMYPVGKRTKAPALQGATLDGDRFALSDLSGHVVVINVWGSWCGPCRGEAPSLARLAHETAKQGVRFMGIDTRDNTAAAKAFERTFGIRYPSVADPDGQVLLAFNGMIPVTAVPSTLVIDGQGDLAAKVIGSIAYPTLRELVHDELATAQAHTGGTKGTTP